jgi:NADH:ubiquinone oxidoreductase subunit K
MLLGILLNFVLFSGLLDDISGFVYFFFVLLVAGVESAVGLSILLFFYMFNGNLIVNIACFLKG